MKAVLLKGYGDVDQLHYEDVPTPEPGPTEVLVRVISTSVNPIDWKIRSGAAKDRMPVQFPYILGRDVAGEVVEVGSEVTTSFGAKKVDNGSVKTATPVSDRRRRRPHYYPGRSRRAGSRCFAPGAHDRRSASRTRSSATWTDSAGDRCAR